MKKSISQPKEGHAGVMRNDLPGFMRVVKGSGRIYVRYKGKDISTGFKNTAIGWKIANDWWAKRSKELQAIEAGEKELEDSIGNIFKKFLEYKQKIDKITKKTETYYITAYKAVFISPQELLTENNAKAQIKRFVETTTVSAASVNIYLRAIKTFLLWCSDEDREYIPHKKYTEKFKQKSVETIKPPYTEDEYNVLLDYFSNSNYAMHLLLQFLWHTGSRCGETLNIKISDIKLEKNYIIVPNKLQKGEQEVLLLSDIAKEIVIKILAFAKNRNDGKLFSWKETRLPNRIMERAEKNLGLKIEGRGLHGFRRAFTDRLIENGVMLEDTKDILRHKNIETTDEHYRKTKIQKLLKELNEKL